MISVLDSTSNVSIIDLVEHQNSVAAGCEEPVVVEAESHPLDGTGVGLDFSDLVEVWFLLVTAVFLQEFPDLNCTWAVLFSKTSEEGFAVMKNVDL